jgi:hypothetical protein
MLFEPQTAPPRRRRTTAAHRPEPRFPPTIVINGRHYNRESDLRRYDAELIAYALGVRPVYPPPPDPDPLVPLKQSEKRYGVGRRTLGRRMKAAEAARKTAEAPASSSNAEETA